MDELKEAVIFQIVTLNLRIALYIYPMNFLSTKGSPLILHRMLLSIDTPLALSLETY